jgi:hypothetical protein
MALIVLFSKITHDMFRSIIDDRYLNIINNKKNIIKLHTADFLAVRRRTQSQ